MLQKILISKTSTQRLIIKIIIGLVLSFVSFGFLLCVVSFFIINVDTPQYILIPITTAMLTFASFLDSFILAKVFKENGLFIGVFVSLVFIIIFISCAVISNSFSLTNLFFTKVVAILLSGVIGGLLGVSI